MKFHHIGIATSSIENLLLKLSKFLEIKEKSEIIYDKNQDASLCMITLSDGTKLELIVGGVVSNLIKKRNDLYHTCYEVSDITKTKNDLINEGAFLVSDAKEAILFNNRKVAFLMWDLGLIELVEENQDGVN